MADSNNCKKSSVGSEEVSSPDSGKITERASWANPVEFILSCMGYAIGLGNVWRFPYLSYRNGGGAFIIIYMLMVIVMGLPIFLLELVIGQYTGQGPNEAFADIAPLFTGLGYCTLVVISFVTIYYMVIVAWTLFYFFATMSSELGWGKCDMPHNTPGCYSSVSDMACQDDNSRSMFYNLSCRTYDELCENKNMLAVADSNKCVDDTDHYFNLTELYKRTLASQEYFDRYMLGNQGATWENFGQLRWQLVLCLLLAWLIVYLCVAKGVKSSGKAVYFTALFPYIVLTMLLARGASLPGAASGLLVYVTPKWELLFDASVWNGAASQTFYSFGIGCGSLITLASYSRFDNNCLRDALVVSGVNCFTSIFAGLSIFAVLGFLADLTQVDISEVAGDGPGLAFVTYPEAILQMPIPQLWSAMFFLMLFTLGLGSQFAGIEAINTAILDRWPQWRSRRPLVAAITCTVCFLLALPMCCDGGVYVFTLLEWNTASWAILLIGLAEVGVVAWCYGCRRFLNDMQMMSLKLSKAASWYWYICWTILTPVSLVAVFIYTMWNYVPARYGADYIFPAWADALGWLIGLSTLAPFPIFAVYVLITSKSRGMDLLRPTTSWGPATTSIDSCNSMEALTRDFIKSVPSDTSLHF